jgi:hypothetical protein
MRYIAREWEIMIAAPLAVNHHYQILHRLFPFFSSKATLICDLHQGQEFPSPCRRCWDVICSPLDQTRLDVVKGVTSYPTAVQAEVYVVKTPT